MDPYRLPRHVRPTRYDLRLEPDLATLTFTGDETITLEIEEPTAEVVLNAVDLAFGEATLANARGESLRGTPVVDEAAERCRITFPSQIAPGTWRLRLAFTGTLERQAARLLPQHATRTPTARRSVDRRHPVRGDRRPPRLPLLGRAGVQGRLRGHAGDRPEELTAISNTRDRRASAASDGRQERVASPTR